MLTAGFLVLLVASSALVSAVDPGPGVIHLYYSPVEWAAEESHVHYNAGNGWISENQKMERSASDSYPAKDWAFFQIMANTFECVFTNNQGRWDNNYDHNYVISEPGIYVIKDNKITALQTFQKATFCVGAPPQLEGTVFAVSLPFPPGRSLQGSCVQPDYFGQVSLECTMEGKWEVKGFCDKDVEKWLGGRGAIATLVTSAVLVMRTRLANDTSTSCLDQNFVTAHAGDINTNLNLAFTSMMTKYPDPRKVSYLGIRTLFTMLDPVTQLLVSATQNCNLPWNKYGEVLKSQFETIENIQVFLHQIQQFLFGLQYAVKQGAKTPGLKLGELYVSVVNCAAMPSGQ